MNDDIAGLRVALVFDDSIDRWGGVTQYVTTLGRRLSVDGAHVTYLVGSSSIDALDGNPVRSLAHNVPVRFNGGAGSMPALSRRDRVREVLAAGAFDVVHVQVPYSPLMAGRVIGQLPERTALVGTFHVNSERFASRAGSRVLATACRRSLARFDAMTAVSPTARRFAAEWFDVVDARIVPNMVEVERFRATPRLAAPSAPCPHVVFVGNLVGRKDVPTLVDAFARLRRRHSRAHLTIAGEGPLRSRLVRQAANRGIREHVTFAGGISETAKAELLAHADVACFPSSYGESFGIVLLEAGAAGCVTVAAANRAYADVLASTPEALYVPGDPQGLASTIERMLSDAQLRGRTRAAQRLIAERHDARRVVGEIAAVYRDALGRRRPSAQKQEQDAIRPAA
jgi:phosphatidyl-myo-inositol alpha-mannosyltransferase